MKYEGAIHSQKGKVHEYGVSIYRARWALKRAVNDLEILGETYTVILAYIQNLILYNIE